MKNKVIVIRENETGRNTLFLDTTTHQKMTRAQFCDLIEAGKYPDYHVRNINDIRTPISNPDKSSKNNLG